MSETTAEYKIETDAFDELVIELNNLNREIQDPKSTIGKIRCLLTTSPKASELVPKLDDALKASNLDPLNPKVDGLLILLRRLKSVKQTI